MGKIKTITAVRLNNGDFFQLIENTTEIASAQPEVAAAAAALLAMRPTMINSFRKEQQTWKPSRLLKWMSYGTGVFIY